MVTIIHDENIIAETLSDSSGNKTIIINPKLKQYGDLYEQTLAHEQEHCQSNGLLDIKTEAKELLRFRNQINMSKFFWHNKRIFLSQLFSFGRTYNGKFYPDYLKLVAGPLIILSIFLATVSIGGWL